MRKSLKHFTPILTLMILSLMFQCSSTKGYSALLETSSQSYMKYVPGAGGGRGIMFSIVLDSIPSNFVANNLVVNGVELPVTMKANTINASIFYPDSEPTLENPNPEPTDAVLFNTSTFVAVLNFTVDDKEGSTTIKDFQEKEQPLYP